MFEFLAGVGYLLWKGAFAGLAAEHEHSHDIL